MVKCYKLVNETNETPLLKPYCSPVEEAELTATPKPRTEIKDDTEFPRGAVKIDVLVQSSQVMKNHG